MENNIKYLVVDVDGTMTDSGVYYDENGNEMKKFSTKDAAGFFAVKELGIKVVVLTGRESNATLRRMKELGVENVFQNIKNKKEFLDAFLRSNDSSFDDIGYIGDDLNDYDAMRLAAFKGCPADSCKEIVEISDYQSSKCGGQGAVRDIIEYYLSSIGMWHDLVQKMYNAGS